MTDGDAGGFDLSLSRDEIPRIRQAEQQNAAAIFGVHDVHFLGLAEGDLRLNSQELHVELVRECGKHGRK